MWKQGTLNSPAVCPDRRHESRRGRKRLPVHQHTPKHTMARNKRGHRSHPHTAHPQPPTHTMAPGNDGTSGRVKLITVLPPSYDSDVDVMDCVDMRLTASMSRSASANHASVNSTTMTQWPPVPETHSLESVYSDTATADGRSQRPITASPPIMSSY